MAHVLVIANETVGSAGLGAAVREKVADGDARFTLVVPMTRPRSGYVIYDEAVRDAAQVRIDLALAYIGREGIKADGEVGDPDPYTAALDAIREYRPDELIVSTLPATSSGWLRRDLIERIGEASGLPVTHVVSDIESEGLSVDVTLVIANQTAGAEQLVTRLKEKAAENDRQLFIIVVPQDGTDGRAPGAARARLGNTLDRLRSEGLIVAGMIGDPDPYTAAMNGLQFFRADSVIVSTLPATRSGWLRADLIERVRKAGNIEVEHVVAEREPAETT